MLGKSLIDTKLRSEAKRFVKKNDQILDMILFGSAMKGKDKPQDIDIIIIFKDKKDLNLSHAFKKMLPSYSLDIIDKTYKELFSDSFIAKEAVLSEGYSLVHDKFFSEAYGYMNLVLFRYSLKGFSNSRRMQFYYSLYGRGQKGMIDELDAIKFSETILLCPVQKSHQMKEYLEHNEIDFQDFPILIPTRLKSIL